MMDEGDDGARVGVWVTVGVITLLLFGLIGGLAIRQSHKGAAKAQPVAAMPCAVMNSPWSNSTKAPVRCANDYATR